MTSDDMAYYDAPAMIDYVLAVTNQDKITYIGHSQGNTVMFAALAEKFGQFDQKLNLFVALAPAVYIMDGTPEWVKKGVADSHGR